jgi:competence protein ComEC
MLIVARLSGEWMAEARAVPRLLALVVAAAFVVWAMRSGRIVATLVFAGAAAIGSGAAIAELDDAVLGPYAGEAMVIVDAEWRFGGANTIVQVEGQRFFVTARDVAGRRLAGVRMGDVVWVSGERVTAARRSHDLHRHVVGRLVVDEVGEGIRAGAPLYRAANAMRALLANAGQHMPRDEAALFLGLVVGDDRGQSREMVESFRASGLSHLTAVSGQNVAFLLAALAPLLTRTRTWWRVAATMAFLAWFVIVTRAEPSVIRAAVTAAITAVGVARGMEVSGRRMLALAMILLLWVDPLLAWSVGFWMSVAATAGLVVLSPRVQSVLRGPKWLRSALATTLGAQLAVAPIALVVFGRLSVTAVATNLMAVPVAGAIMFVGLPLGLVVGSGDAVVTWGWGTPLGALGDVLMAPVTWATRFVWWVAVVGSRHP